MLGVPIDRFWSNEKVSASLKFIDLPGVDITDDQAMASLKRQLQALPSPRIHLVLNAAYDMPALLEQWEAFAPFDPEDLIFTHLDEEQRRVKLWNFVLGTNYSIRFLSAGQNIPGNFQEASADKLFMIQLPAG